jgi:hypothetical protein
MLIKDLSKELDTQTMTGVRGGVALSSTQQPYQVNDVHNRYNVTGNSGSVAIDGTTNAENEASLPSIQGSVFISDFARLLRL